MAKFTLNIISYIFAAIGLTAAASQSLIYVIVLGLWLLIVVVLISGV